MGHVTKYYCERISFKENNCGPVSHSNPPWFRLVLQLGVERLFQQVATSFAKFVYVVVSDPSQASRSGRRGLGYRGRWCSGRAGTPEARTHSGEEKPSPERPSQSASHPSRPRHPRMRLPRARPSLSDCACAGRHFTPACRRRRKRPAGREVWTEGAVLCCAASRG